MEKITRIELARSVHHMHVLDDCFMRELRVGQSVAAGEDLPEGDAESPGIRSLRELAVQQALPAHPADREAGDAPADSEIMEIVT